MPRSEPAGWPRRRRWPPWRLYFAAGKLGLFLAVVHPIASPVWPASGIAIAAVLLLGQRVWPALFAAAFLVNFSAGAGIASSLGIAVGNSLEAVVGGWLGTRFARGVQAFERSQDVFKFVVLAGLLATTISATIGTTPLALAGSASWADYGRIWLTWWLGDAGGALIVAPAVICWITAEPFECGRAQLVEAIAFLALFIAVGMLVFGLTTAPMRFLCLPLVIWSAYRFGRCGTAAFESPASRCGAHCAAWEGRRATRRTSRCSCSRCSWAWSR